jgi:uncharacterized protein (TIGR03437 family)
MAEREKPMAHQSKILAALFAAGASLYGQTPSALAVDAGANRHAISPWIYGINQWNDNGIQGIMRIPLVRWGGDDATSFNWSNSLKNNTGDNPWVYENYSISPSFDSFHLRNLKTGSTSMSTFPLLDWLPKSPGQCSFSVKKYGAQKSTNPDNPDCGNGVLTNGTNIVNDPNDAYIPVTPADSQPWIQHEIDTYGPGNGGGIRFWSLDNEPEWWDSVHYDVYKTAPNGKNGASYDDMMTRSIQAALAIKQTDPTALVTGPVPGGWSGMLFSKQDFYAGWSKAPYQFWDNPVDQKAHGGVAWVPYYLQQMQAASNKNGVRLLDVLDVHAYITPSGLSGSAGNTAMETLRMTSTRALWDPNYTVPGGGYQDATGAEQAPQMVPRLKQWVAANYAGTMTAITEYNWGAQDTITGAIAQADILGIFGREGLDLATVWPNTLTPANPAAFSFMIFLNYDGSGSQFGDTSISATSDNPDELSIFAAQRTDSTLTILVLNKITSAITDSISLANFMPAGTAQVWQYSTSNKSAIVRQPDLTLSGTSLNATFPSYSMTLFVIPQSQSAMTVPQPAISSVSNAASYNSTGVSPGEIVAIFGQNLGTASIAYLQEDSNGLVATSTGNTRVYFNGVAAPMIYSLDTQVSAVVPYEMAQYNTVNVVVEYSGNSSAPFPVKVAPAVPGIFTNDASGTGQGAILNVKDSTRNGVNNPAARGDYVTIYATGEGLTNPPVIDGRVSGVPLQKPTLSCSATIGGQSATIEYCGAAPGEAAGVLQINALVPQSSATGGSVPIMITIGNTPSTAGVTMAVK